MSTKNIKTIKTFGFIAGIFIGLGIYSIINAIFTEVGNTTISELVLPWANALIIIFIMLSFGVIFYKIAPRIIDKFVILEKRLKELPPKDLLIAVIGLALGLFIAYLLSRLLDMISLSWVSVPISVILYGFLGYLGTTIAISSKDNWSLSQFVRKGLLSADGDKHNGQDKVMDTSTIIDGRIYEVAKTGFLEGKLYVPQFILTELRHIADSQDELKRNRGRRGLDILNSMQKYDGIDIEVLDTDFEENIEVDAKLIKLAAQMDAKVITNDYNLNKVAIVQGVAVLNINDLVNSLKPIALPGEKMTVRIVKEGRESEQGVAFLDDGTMIVVQDARNRIGESLYVEVTSALQTSAGRMIFAKILND